MPDSIPHDGRSSANGALGSVEEQFRLLMESVQDYALVLMTPEGHVASWSVGGEHVLGYTEPEAVGQPFAHFFTPEDVADGVPQKELQKAESTGRANDDRWHLHKNGARIWCSGVTTALRDASGNLRGFAKVMRDLTERKNLLEQLQKRAEQLTEANRCKDEFLAMLAHELRNPLAPIRNALHLIRTQSHNANILAQSQAMAERQVSHMTRLIDDLLDVSRISQGKIRLRKEPVDLGRIIASVVEAARPALEAKGHHFSLDLPSHPVRLEADPTRLEQVLNNLLTNAAKYTEPGGRIWLTVEQDGDAVRLSMRDTGIGLLPEMLPRVFDLFVQGERGLARSQGGLGIGLTLVKRLVELHGGRVEAISEGPGKGSEFVVHLPALPAEIPESQADDLLGSIAPGRALRVLIVDDNADAVETLAMILRLWQHEVQVAHDGTQALQVAAAFRPDVVLLDIGLPGMSGYEVARHLRKQTGKRDMVLVALTGYGQEEDLRRSREAGFDLHLVKPVRPETLQVLLGKVTV